MDFAGSHTRASPSHGTATPHVRLLTVLHRQTMAAALVRLGGDLEVIQANQAFAATVGVARAAAVGRHPAAFLEPQGASRWRAALDAAAAAQEDWSAPVVLATGGGKTYQASLLPLYSDQGAADFGLLRLMPQPVPMSFASVVAAKEWRRHTASGDGPADAEPRDAHLRALKAFRLMGAMISREVARVRDRQARGSLTRLRERADALAHILDVMNRSGAPLQPCLERLCAEMKDAAWQTRDPDDVEIRVAAVPLAWPPERLVVLLLAVHELVGNALRHAFPDGITGTVDVRVFQVDDVVRLVVEDDGCGMAPDALVKDRFGLNMVEAMVKHAGGMMTLSGGYGTQVMLRLPAA